MRGLPAKRRVVLIQAVLVLFILTAVFLFSGCYIDPNVRVGVAVPEYYTVAPICCNVFYGGGWHYSRSHWGHGYNRGWHHR